MNSFDRKIISFLIITYILNLNLIKCLPVNSTINVLNEKEVKVLVVPNKPKSYDNKTVVKYQDQKSGKKKTIENGKGDSFKETYGSSDEVEYHKVFHTKGSKGYDNFETFHKKDSNEYELRDEDKSGENRKIKLEKQNHVSKDYKKDIEEHKDGKELIEDYVSISFEEENDMNDHKSKENFEKKNLNKSEYNSEEIASSHEISQKKKIKPKSIKARNKLNNKSSPHVSELKFSQKIRDKHKHKICKKPSKRRLNKIALPFTIKSNSAILRKLPQINSNKYSDSKKFLQITNGTNFVPKDEMKALGNSNIQVFSMQSGILSSKLPISQHFKEQNKTNSNNKPDMVKIFTNSTINGQIVEVIQPQALSQVEANFIPNKSFGYDTIIYHDEEDVAQSLKNDSPDEKNSIINFYSPDFELGKSDKNENDNSGSKEEPTEQYNPPTPENPLLESEDINESEPYNNNESDTMNNEEITQEQKMFSEKPIIEESEIEKFNENKEISNHRIEEPEYRPKKKHKLKIIAEPYYESESSQPDYTTEQLKIKKDKKRKKKSKKRIKRPKNESVESTIKKLELKNRAAQRVGANETEELTRKSEKNSRKFIEDNIDKFTELPTIDIHNRKKKSRRKTKKENNIEKNEENLSKRHSSEENVNKKLLKEKNDIPPRNLNTDLRNEGKNLRNDENTLKPTKKHSKNKPRSRQKKKKKKLIKLTTTEEPEIYYDDEPLNKSNSTEDESEIYYDEIKDLDNQDFVIVVDDDKKIQASKIKQAFRQKPKYKVEESNENESNESDSEDVEHVPLNIQNKNGKIYENDDDDDVNDDDNVSSEESNEPNNADECSNCDYEYEE